MVLNVNGREYPYGAKVVASQEQILERIQKVAVQIQQDYRGKISMDNPLILICVLKGSYHFTSDLSRALADHRVPNVVEFLCVSSYGDSTQSSGEVRVLLDIRNTIQKRHVLIVEDIIDSARTLDFLVKIFMTRSPASLNTICLLDKPSGRKVDFSVTYGLFTIEGGFVVGYGLDYAERYRDLRDIIVLKPEVYDKTVADRPHTIPSKL